ncbi:MAG: hypothetical protein AAGI22_10250 [Planctomycetota bacterium]
MKLPTPHTSLLVPLLLSLPLLHAAPTGARAQEEAEDLEPGLRVALEHLRETDPDRAERILAGLREDDEDAWRELDLHFEFLERLEDAEGPERRLLERDQRYAAAVRADVEAFRAAPTQEAEAALRQLLDDWFGVRQELRRMRVDRLREEMRAIEEDEGEDAETDLDRGFPWLVGALEEAREETLEDLVNEHAEQLGSAMERVSERLGEWWWEIVETDAEGAAFALERWRAEEPEQARAVERAGGAELGLIAAEVQLVRAVLALKEERRGEPEEVAEALLRGPAAASLRPLLEHIGALELAMARQEREHVRRQLQRLPAEIERREQMRALLVTAELLRRTDRGDVLEW